MGVIKRTVVFVAGTIGNAVLFLVFSRGILVMIDIGNDVAPSGPGSGAINSVPLAIQLAIGCIQLALIAYLLGGFGEESVSSRRPMR